MKFSIIMTVFEKWGLTQRALQCVLDQKHKDWELLIYIDGEPPIGHFHPKRAITQASKQTNNKISCVDFLQERETFGNQARHRGLREATGDYLIWLGHDNIIYPNYLMAHKENVTSSPGCISVVPIQYWCNNIYKGVMPIDYRVGRIDLLCFSFPATAAIVADVFGADTERVYAADWKAFQKMRELKLKTVKNSDHGPVGAHF